MSSSPLPVPRKVALTAVRGLLVGTSCTLALVAEDRRRKINNAIRVIENGEKIKSARNYHGSVEGGIAWGKEDGVPADPIVAVLLKHGVSLGMERGDLRRGERSEGGSSKAGGDGGPHLRTRGVGEGSETSAPLAEPTVASSGGAGIPVEVQGLGSRTINGLRGTDFLHSQRLGSTVGDGERGREISTQAGHESGSMPTAANDSNGLPKARDHVPLPSLQVAPQSSRTAHPPVTQHLIRLEGSQQLWPSLGSDILKSVAARTSEEVMVLALAACQAPVPDPSRVTEAVQAFVSLCDNRADLKAFVKWTKASALLCRTCQDIGLVEEAETVLTAMQKKGPLRPADYFANNPFALIRSLIDLAGHASNKDISEAYLDKAVKIFITQLAERPSDEHQEGVDTGVALINTLFQANRIRDVGKVFTRCGVYMGQEKPNHLADWFLGELMDHGEHKKAVDLFLHWRRQFRLSGDSIARVAGCVVQAVQQGHDYKPSLVFKALVKVCSGVCHVQLNWIAKLFTADWDRYHDFGRIEKLFEFLLTFDLSKITQHPTRIYRLMVEMALRADDVRKAQMYLETAATLDPEVLTHPHWLGLLAAYKAKQGEWEGVRLLFSEMVPSTEERSEALAMAFVPVLKLFAKTHSLEDMKQFVHLYTTKMNVPLRNYTVTLMMTQCANAQDVSGVIEWLRVCETTGFKVDATIVNTILPSCRKANMPFRDIRTLYRKIQAMNPDFVDKHTEKIMANAAFHGASLNGDPRAGRRARGRCFSMRLNSTNASMRLAGKGRPVPEQDLVLAMKEAMVIGGHARALWIYKQALHQGMRPSVYALRLAVRAELNMPDRQRSSARIQELLRYAEVHGQDVQYVTNQVIAISLKEISEMTRKRDIYPEVRAAIEHFESGGIMLSDAVYNWAAHACLKARHFRGTIYYAHKAVEAMGASARPGYNRHSFMTLLMCYVELLDADKIRETIEYASCRPHSKETQYLTMLKVARKRVAMAGSASDAADATDEVLAQRRDDTLQAIREGIAQAVRERSALNDQRKLLEEKILRVMRKAASDSGLPPVDFDTIPWLGGKALGESDENVMRPGVDMKPPLETGDVLDNVEIVKRALEGSS
ncbi:hypothetical protein B0T16DRAFT_416156 [Cercophora newfieldiana]|uniref:Pentatricopeptide repeat protein n=1 Tax=Cercophora newfieldiana TaxID=92897 RepID=A0AA40CN63_9PEZI|nr:hypothetical protein B0T16DRAFT_416156 [Cercophora newfieldiana]